MESNVSKISTCEFETSIVSYLYHEMPASERDGFESHLLECTQCTDEFAGMSYSRFSVFEWQREEFAPLATPQIVIPYPAKALDVSGSLGYFSGIRELLTFNWKTGFAVAGIFAIFLGIGFALLYVRVETVQQFVAVDDKKAEEKLDSLIFPLPATVTVADATEIPIVETIRNNPAKPVQAKSVVAETRRAKVNRSRRLNVPQFDNDIAQQRIDRGSRMAPALSTDTEEDDRSLRLADLFDDDTRL